MDHHNGWLVFDPPDLRNACGFLSGIDQDMDLNVGPDHHYCLLCHGVGRPGPGHRTPETGALMVHAGPGRGDDPWFLPQNTTNVPAHAGELIDFMRSRWLPHLEQANLLSAAVRDQCNHPPHERESRIQAHLGRLHQQSHDPLSGLALHLDRRD